MIKMLEVGPGSISLVAPSPRDPNWVHFNASDYTAIEPDLPNGSNEFRTSYLSLPNVRLIRARIQDAQLTEGSFDEAFASSVTSDSSIAHEVPDILNAMARALRVGGLMTLLNTNTPECGPSAEQVIAMIGTRFHIVHALEFGRDYWLAQTKFPLPPSEEWTKTAGVYSYAIRHAAKQQKPEPFIIGSFIQLAKN